MRTLKKKSNRTLNMGKAKQEEIKEEKAGKKTRKRLLKSKKSQNGGTGKRKLRKRFKKQRCAYFRADGSRCKNQAVGKSTLCSDHGGSRIVKDNLVPSNSALVPTKFNPAVHPLSFIELSRNGLSDVEIAAEFEVGIETVRTWADTYEEFAVAWEIGAAMYEAFFLREGRRNLSNTRFNTSLFKFLTGNKLGYTEKIESKNFNANVNHGVLLVPDAMSIDEWEKQNIKEDAEKKAKESEEEEDDAIDADYKEV